MAPSYAAGMAPRMATQRPLDGHSVQTATTRDDDDATATEDTPGDVGPPGTESAYLQPGRRRPFRRRRRMGPLDIVYFAILLLACLVQKTNAVFIDFENCLPDTILTPTAGGHLILQWIPLYVDAKFIKRPNSHILNITAYGNVTGQETRGTLPPPHSPQWRDDDESLGKIVNVTGKTITTLFSKFHLLTYTPFEAEPAPFCDTLLKGKCPLGPSFFANPNHPEAFPAVSVAHDFFSSYAFTTLASTITATSPVKNNHPIVCVSTSITPDLGSTISSVLAYIPVMVLAFMAIATVLSATASPWGTTDPFKWSSNYGRDEDLLRLVTPGFGDCLQYIQFIVLSGGLTLSYPGFFQPVVSQVGWSALMFNESFVSHGDGARSLIDGIYVTKGDYGLDRMSQLIGMTKDYDAWAGMAVWLLVIVAAIVLLCQIGFLLRWGFRTLANNPPEDLRSKNWPFTGGNLVRVVCNFFLLPIVSLSTFQMVIASESPKYVVALAAVLLAAILAFAAWILRLIVTTKPRSHLFDDLPTVLLYGPLYNTYSDDAAPFALVPALLTFLRGVAIGAVQASGIAQLVILAICEVIFILTLHAFRPFHSPTSMNAYHTIFASVRLVVVLLMVSFAPSLGLTEGPKGWIGYVILLLHAIVLVFGFFLNSIQTILEVVARLLGAGGEDGATRGPLSKTFGVRQLSRRQKRSNYRYSQNSDAAIMTDDGDAKSAQFGARSRSISASSAILLNQQRASDPRLSAHLDRSTTGGTNMEMPVEPRAYSIVGPSRKPQLGIKTAEVADPYYRPPRQRRQTGELMTPGAKSRVTGSGDWTNNNLDDSPESIDKRDSPPGRPGSLSLQQMAPSATQLRKGEESEINLNDPRQSNVDYTVREVDYYYGIRGPALSSQAARKLRTGPADPVGPVSSATGWFKGMFGRKQREKSKGFEVVRSSRAPPQIFDEEAAHPVVQEPYHDSPPLQQEAYLPGQRTRSNPDAPDDEENTSEVQSVSSAEYPSPSEYDEEEESDGADGEPEVAAVSALPPSLAPIESGGGLDLPSRFNSRTSEAANRKASKRGSRKGSRRAKKEQASSGALEPVPVLPVRSPRRNDSGELGQFDTVELHGPPATQEPTRQIRGSTSAPRVPFSDPQPGSDPRRWSGGAGSIQDDRPPTPVQQGFHRKTPSNASSLPPAVTAQDRPTSVGYVNQYRASDSIQHPRFGEYLNTGSSAQVVDSSPRLSRDVNRLSRETGGSGPSEGEI